MGDVETGAGFRNQVIAEFDDLGEVMAGIHMEQFKRHRGRGEGATGQFEDDNGVLAAREEEAYLIELPGHLAQDVDGFIF